MLPFQRSLLCSRTYRLCTLTAVLGMGFAAASSPAQNLAPGALVQGALPEAPSALLLAGNGAGNGMAFSTSADDQAGAPATQPQNPDQTLRNQENAPPQQGVDANGKPIRPQTGRIFGIFPNFVSVSGGTRPKPAGWKTDFRIANKQNYDYSSFGFLLISSALAYGQNSHPALNTVDGGDAIFWAYLWRGFVDKTDGTYQASFFFPALLHEDTRYYAMGTGGNRRRLTHAILSVVVAHTYEGKPTFNAAGLIGRAGAQAVSTTYYPAGSEGFGVLAQKYSYSILRSVIYAVVREYSPDAQARVHFGHKGPLAAPAAPQATAPPETPQPATSTSAPQ